jgi:hypothetical protein
LAVISSQQIGFFLDLLVFSSFRSLLRRLSLSLDPDLLLSRRSRSLSRDLSLFLSRDLLRSLLRSSFFDFFSRERDLDRPILNQLVNQ